MSDLVYQLKIIVNGNEQQASEHNLNSGSTIGSSSDVDIPFPRHGLAPINGKFNIQSDVLTYTHLGETGDTLIGEQKCQHKKMYILDVNDFLVMGELKCLIKKGIPTAPELMIDQEEIQSKMSLNSEPQVSLSNPVLDEEPDGMTLIGLEIMRPDGTHENAELEKDPEEPNEIKEEKEKINSLPQKAKNPVTKKINKKRPSDNNSIEKMIAKKKKKKVRIKRAISVAGILPRLVGDIYNIIIFTSLYLYFHVSEHELLNVISNKLFPYYKKTESFLKIDFPDVKDIIFSSDFLKIMVALLIWNVVTGLLFSVNLGQWLIGLYSSGSFILRRLLAPLRVMLSLITWPFLVFDAPVVLRKRSLKELLTASETTLRSPTLTAFLSLVILPLTIIYLASYELIMDKDALDNFKVNPISKLPIKILPLTKKQSDLNDVKTLTFASSHLGRSIKAKVISDIELIAELTNNNKDSNIRYSFYDKGINVFVDITHRQLIVASEISSLLEKDPFLLFHSKNIFPTIKNNLNHIDSKIIKIIYDVLTLSKENIFDHISSYGLYINPYLKLRKKTLRKLAPIISKDFLLMKKAGEYYLTFNDNDHVYLVTTNDLGISLYTFKTSNDKAKELLSKKYIEDVHPDSKVLTKDIKIDNSFEAIYKITKGKMITPDQAKVIIDEYMRLASDALIKDNQFYTEKLLEIFKSNEQQFLRYIKKQSDPNLSELRLALNRIQKALYKREKEFFEINIPQGMK